MTHFSFYDHDTTQSECAHRLARYLMGVEVCFQQELQRLIIIYRPGGGVGGSDFGCVTIKFT